jgi:hypothetical protein
MILRQIDGAHCLMHDTHKKKKHKRLTQIVKNLKKLKNDFQQNNFQMFTRFRLRSQTFFDTLIP